MMGIKQANSLAGSEFPQRLARSSIYGMSEAVRSVGEFVVVRELVSREGGRDGLKSDNLTLRPFLPIFTQ